MIGDEGFAQGYGDHWGEFAVDFDDEIHIGSGAFAGSGDDFDGVLYDARLRLVLVSACDGIKFDGGEAFGNGGFCVFIHLFGCGAAREEVQANFVAAVATEEFPDRDLEVFAFDVVQGDVHCADGTAERGAAKGGHAVEVLPVVFYAHGVLSDEVFFEDFGDGLDGFGIAPAGGSANAGDAGVGGEADDIAVAEQEVFDLVNFHALLLVFRYGIERNLGYITR